MVLSVSVFLDSFYFRKRYNKTSGILFPVTDLTAHESPLV